MDLKIINLGGSQSGLGIIAPDGYQPPRFQVGQYPSGPQQYNPIDTPYTPIQLPINNNNTVISGPNTGPTPPVIFPTPIYTPVVSFPTPVYTPIVSFPTPVVPQNPIVKPPKLQMLESKPLPIQQQGPTKQPPLNVSPGQYYNPNLPILVNPDDFKEEKEETFLNRKFDLGGLKLNSFQLAGGVLVSSVVAYKVYEAIKKK
jgi:hypothetical protein